ncbi:MAG: hypothetical protein KA327_11035 [Pseudarcicella sp.]|nr:hypothetical protein [Pseudarcicella sp.]
MLEAVIITNLHWENQVVKPELSLITGHKSTKQCIKSRLKPHFPQTHVEQTGTHSHSVAPF